MFTALISILTAGVLSAPSPSIDPVALAEPAPRSLFERTVDRTRDPNLEIRRHLLEVLAELRARPVDDLSPEQATRRAAHLDVLREYAEAGVFPRNRWVPGLRPVFIDDGGRACAVGHLMTQSGAGELARRISREANLAYLPDITTPGVAEWIEESGLTATECAMIQPAYPCGVFSEFTCTGVDADVLLTWSILFFPFDVIQIERDGELIVELTQVQPMQEFLDVGVPAGDHVYTITGQSWFSCSHQMTCTVTVTQGGDSTFMRGDVNGDGQLTGIPDAIALLSYAFLGGAPPPCMEAADVDGNGAFQPLSDVVYLFGYSFSDGPAPGAPFPTCDVDPDPAATLGCETTTTACP